MNIDMSNSNSYRVVVNETDGSRTAYYFSVPVYNRHTGRMLDLTFTKIGNRLGYVGSSCSVDFYSDSILFSNGHKSVKLVSTSEKLMFSPRKLIYENAEVVPTTNGIAFFTKTDISKQVKLVLRADHLADVRANNKYFAIMQSKFCPLVTISCIGTTDQSGRVVAPALLQYSRNGDSYEITLTATGENGKYIAYEINMYERKLFQDTTVETADPESNNVFGSVAYIGNSSAFGQQWLYWKTDNSLINDISSYRIRKAKLHMPVLNTDREKLSAFHMAARFCSFGSNWDNKTKSGLFLGEAERGTSYLNLDITPLISDNITQRLSASNGMILRPKATAGGFVAVSTGDSFYKPQILEINYF